VPQNRPRWLDKPHIGDEILDIEETEFLDSLIVKHQDETWLNVKGAWYENNGSIKASYYVTSAFAKSETSVSLLNALTTCTDFRDYKLPNYRERDMEIISKPFVLRGWIKERDTSKGFDEFDPLAGEIQYPPYRIGKKIRKVAHLSVSKNGKDWYIDASKDPVLISKLYSSQNRHLDEQPEQMGNVVKAKLSFLQSLCVNLESDLIVEVQITRNYVQRHRKNDETYRDSVNKVYILSADGRIRTTTESDQLG
jgi:hypothetical protein